MRTRHLLMAIVATVSLAACSLTTGLDGRVIGVIQGDSDDLPVLEAPDTVEAGIRFAVVVRTYGSSGCWSEAGAERSTTGLVIAITPYDRHKNVLCHGALVRLPRTLAFSLSQRGEGVIRVTGRAGVSGSGSGSRDTYATVEKRVIVR